MAVEERSYGEPKKKVKSLISVTAWVVAGDVHCVSLPGKTVDAVHDRLCHSALLPAWDLRSGGGQKEQGIWILLITRVMDITIRCVRAGFGRVDAAFGTEDTVYLHLGQNEIVPDHRIIGIFDLDKCSYEKRTGSI